MQHRYEIYFFVTHVHYIYVISRNKGKKGSVIIGHFKLANLKYSSYNHYISTKY